MPRYKVILECSGPAGDAALTRLVTASSSFAAEFAACQSAGNEYPEYSNIRVTRTEAFKSESD